MNFVNVESIERENDSKKREDNDDLLTLFSLSLVFILIYLILKKKTKKKRWWWMQHPSHLCPTHTYNYIFPVPIQCVLFSTLFDFLVVCFSSVSSKLPSINKKCIHCFCLFRLWISLEFNFFTPTWTRFKTMIFPIFEFSVLSELLI